MNRDLLYRFFEEKATTVEEEQIRHWMESSNENLSVFYKERAIYDALLLTRPQVLEKQKQFSPSLLWKVSAVAAVALLLIISGLFLLNTINLSEEYNTVLVPAGQRINLILSDNTNVWLNANTEFRYPTHFSKKNRTVYLDGEAYFDVSKNEKSPFIVKTEQGDVLVTGTSFNVEAYSSLNTFETSLFEGGVEIYKNDEKLVSLKPNEKSTLKNNQLIVSEITDTDEFLWRKGLIAFNNKKLEEILLSLEKYFDVKIEINSKQLSQHTYTGKFRQSDGVEYALRVLQRSIRFNYERNEETGIVYIK